MDAFSQDAFRCPKCQAPIGQGGGRCPFCGADLPQDTTAKPFVPAIVGLTEHHEAARARAKSRSPAPVKKSSTSVGTIALIGGGIVVLTIGGSLILRAALQPKAAPSAPPAVSVSAPEVLMLNGIPIQDRHKIDATDLLTSVRRRVAEGNLDAALVDISVSGAQAGGVDMSAPGAQIVYHYVVSPPNTSAADPLSARERAEFVVSDAALPVKKTPSNGDKAVPDPICVWSAAWRAAIASGLSPSLLTDAKYAYNPKLEKATWVFTVRDNPELEREVDGMSCTIRVRQGAVDAGKRK
jgi:hypothetical protein